MSSWDVQMIKLSEKRNLCKYLIAEEKKRDNVYSKNYPPEIAIVTNAIWGIKS
jgi:hypothetical protein